MCPYILSDEGLARVDDIPWLETEIEVAVAEAARMERYAKQCRLRLAELRGRC